MSGNEFFCKQLCDQEAESLAVLDQLGLTHITVPFEIEQSTLIMAQGEPVEGAALLIEPVYRDCLADLYSVKSARYSPGLYAFYGTPEVPSPEEPYGHYLARQSSGLLKSLEGCSSVIIRSIAAFCSELLRKSFQKHMSALDSQQTFSLLHGDLHSGNILQYRGAYKLIDFEFMRFGPVSMEIAFLLFWDYITGEAPFPSRDDLTRQAECAGHICGLTSKEADQILTVFMPVFLLCAASGLIEKRYSDPISIQKGLKSFYVECLKDGGRNDSLH